MITYSCPACGEENTLEDARIIPAFTGSFGQGADEPPESSYIEDAPDVIRCEYCNRIVKEEWLIEEYG